MACMSLYDIEFNVFVSRCEAPETSNLEFNLIFGRCNGNYATTRLFTGNAMASLDFVPSCGMEIGDFKVIRVKMKRPHNGFIVYVSSKFCEDPNADIYPKRMFASWEEQMKAIQAQQFIAGLNTWRFVETTDQEAN